MLTEVKPHSLIQEHPGWVLLAQKRREVARALPPQLKGGGPACCEELFVVVLAPELLSALQTGRESSWNACTKMVPCAMKERLRGTTWTCG